MDTGGLYFVCEPGVAQTIGLSAAERLDEARLSVRGRTYRGSLYRLSLSLLPGEGDIACHEVTVFVPTLEPSEEWPLPSFLGFQYCLERFRLGLDPSTDTLYFEALD